MTRARSPGGIASFAATAATTAVLFTASACAPTEIHTLHTLHTDSAGIPIVTAVAPVWGPDDAWTVDPEPLVEILRSIHVDATGHLWLQPYYVAGAEPPPFEIHAPDGFWLGSLSVPPGLQRAFVQYQAPYMEIGEDYMLGVWTDELDVQYVRMYRINK